MTDPVNIEQKLDINNSILKDLFDPKKQVLTPQKYSKTYERHAKIGRNKNCPCGSDLKYKHCCGNVLKQEPLYSKDREYSDKMGEQGVAEQVFANRDLGAELYTDAIELINKLNKKWARNRVVQSGMFSDALSCVNIMGLRNNQLVLQNERLRIEMENAKSQAAIAEDKLLKYKVGKNEVDTVSKEEPRVVKDS